MSVQEAASQGVAVAHDTGDAAARERLVTALVATLQGHANPNKAIKVEGDSEIVDPNAVSKRTTAGSGSSGSFTTYKELCSMATDLGQPDLVYSFLDIANQGRALKSKRCAAFCVTSIAKQSLTSLQPHIAETLPKLYRCTCAAASCVSFGCILLGMC